MSDCQHEKTTIDCVCLNCGYDLIVDARDDKIRKAERERIIKMLERTCDCDKSNPVLIIHRCQNRFAIADIKGETE